MPAGRVLLWVASLGAIALTVRSMALGAVPWGIAIAALVGYLALTVVGVLVPQLEMFGDVSWQGDGSTNGVALTFDDGPHPVTTRRILDVLANAQVTATFFVVGAKVEKHPEIVRAIVAGGHTLGAHGYDHNRLY
jgi:peptidoglycan/xylan/chitin deacetylase (PgdA/CDA1 family)